MDTHIGLHFPHENNHKDCGPFQKDTHSNKEFDWHSGC